jgi:hypothetical protein
VSRRDIVWFTFVDFVVAWTLLVDALIFGDRRAIPRPARDTSQPTKTKQEGH